MKFPVSLFFVFLFLFALESNAQSPNIPLNRDYYQIIDRIEILNGESNFHSTVKPYTRIAVGKLVDSLGSSDLQDKAPIDFIRYENADYTTSTTTLEHQPLFKFAYKKSPNFLSVYDEKLTLHVNPLIQGELGTETEGGNNLYRNTRGVELFGNIMNKVGFYTSVTENQVVFPSYVQNYIGSNTVIPGAAFWKRFRGNGVDYFLATGYLSFNLIEPINLQFGYDNQFIGNGYRSLILSDFAAPRTYLKLNTKVWKFSYTNLFTELTSDVLTSGGVPKGNEVYPKKYMALHHLNLKVGKKLDLGFFESIIFERNDSTGGFELNYLNPIIFYRSVEQNLGSPDNALLGFDFKWNFARKFSLYGQFVFDELVVKEFLAGDGWWGNKQSGQLGLKYINAFGAEGLDLQGELNVVRPFMYSHTTASTSYSHYLQPLAHPLGANFYEMVGIATYKPMSRFSATGTLIYSKFGAEPTDSSNVGTNILLPNDSRDSEYGNRIAQGAESTLLILDLNMSYRLRNGWFIDVRPVVRHVESDISALSKTTFIFNAGLRLHLARRNDHF